MADITYSDRIQENCQFAGVGDVTLTGARDGYITFLNGNTDYVIHNVDSSLWEVGEGTITAGILVRDTVYSNHLGTTNKIDFGFAIGIVSQSITALRMNRAARAMVWKGHWRDQTYASNDVVNNSNWLMIANKPTADRASPQGVGYKLDTIDPATGISSVGNSATLVRMHHEFIITKDGYLEDLSIYTAGSIADLVTKVSFLYKGSVTVIYNPIITADSWTLLMPNNSIMRVGEVLEVDIELYHSNPVSEIIGNWGLVIGTGVPVDQTVNLSTDIDGAIGGTLVIDHDDVDSGDRTVALRGIAVGSIIVIQEARNSAKSVTVITTSVDTTNTAIYSTFSYNVIGIGLSGTVTDGNVMRIVVTVPIVASTSYPIFLAPPAPSFCTPTSSLSFNGVDQGAAIGTNYGVNIGYREASLSDDWDEVYY